MALTLLSSPLASLERVGDFVNEFPERIVVHVPDADTVIAVASLKDSLRRPVGVWLEVSEQYPASIAARDVKTLSWLIALDVVVLEGAQAPSHVQILEALLSDDEVTLATDVAVLTRAYNRPAPPRPIDVWYVEGSSLKNSASVLTKRDVSERDFGVLTSFA